MPVVSVWIENVWRYLLLTRFTDVLDVALMAFLLYKLLTLLKTTSGTNLLKGVLIFLAVLFLSSILHLNGISFILSWPSSSSSSRRSGGSWSRWAASG